MAKKGVAASHVYGTIHVADARLAELPAPVLEAFAGAKSLMLEFLADVYSKERFLEAAMFLDSQTLEQKIGAEDFERAFEHLDVQRVGQREQQREVLRVWPLLQHKRDHRRAGHAHQRAQPMPNASE